MRTKKRKPAPPVDEFADVDAWVEKHREHTDAEWDEQSFMRRWRELCEQPGPITDRDVQSAGVAIG